VKGGQLAALACVVLGLVSVPAANAASANGLTTAIYLDPGSSLWSGPSAGVAFDRIRRTGAAAVRITVFWFEVAPSRRPEHWDPTNPADPSYRWGDLDREVVNAVQHGLEPLITIMSAPTWAQAYPPADDPYNSHLPDPVAFGEFAKAVATRYSGSFQGLPRVRLWQAWNEPNISLYLIPQLENGQPVSPDWYRRMLNEFASVVHSVNPDNLVVAGGLAPFRDITPYVLAQDSDWGPLSFMRAMLCLSKSLKPTCSDRASFDVWATHPYTSGGPLHHAVLGNDVSLGDLPEMRATLAAAVKAGHVNSQGSPRFWVTEFSWDSNPPDPCSPPLALLSRWIPEGLYRMWDNGIDLVVWLQLQDQPMTSGLYQSGFFYYSDNLATARAKATIQAFRFPFVSLQRGHRVFAWGRTPFGKPARVAIQQRSRRRWKNVTAVNTDRFGIFQRVVKAKPVGLFRARLFPTNESSLPFSMRVPPDHFYNPFGLTTVLEPTGQPAC
jgi:hypothetical protein